jgi:hypothetical protein
LLAEEVDTDVRRKVGDVAVDTEGMRVPVARRLAELREQVVDLGVRVHLEVVRLLRRFRAPQADGGARLEAVPAWAADDPTFGGALLLGHVLLFGELVARDGLVHRLLHRR